MLAVKVPDLHTHQWLLQWPHYTINQHAMPGKRAPRFQTIFLAIQGEEEDGQGSCS